jgi:nucleoside-diphosphate-sugar epimerase
VVIRPPLIYGKNAPGNFAALSSIAKLNIPLPLGAINNRRSFVAIDNLIDLIITCTKNKNAANQTFLVSDGVVISTTSFFKLMKKALGKNSLLLPIPVSFMKFIAAIIGKKNFVDKLSNSLTIDIGHTKETLNWEPPISIDEGIRRCFE